MRWLGAICFSIVMLAQHALAAPVLERGVNLSHWLQYEGRQPVVAADMAAIKAAGFDHVRIAFDPFFLGWRVEDGADPTLLPRVELLDKAIDMALAAGLDAIVDFHPRASRFEEMENSARGKSAFVALWGALARRYADRPVDRVAFEILNEPQYYRPGPRAWNDLAAKALAAIRQAAPNHLVLIACTEGSRVEALEKLAAVNDPQVAYVFHFYDPYLVTHLNAPWEPWKSNVNGMVSGIVYPAAQMTISGVFFKRGANLREASGAVSKYMDQGWGPERMTQMAESAAAWAKRHQARLVVTEFGVLRQGIDTGSRLRWLQDVRTALETAGIGWTVWDYADVFGVAQSEGAVSRQADGAIVPRDMDRVRRRFEPAALEALGLP